MKKGHVRVNSLVLIRTFPFNPFETFADRQVVMPRTIACLANGNPFHSHDCYMYKGFNRSRMYSEKAENAAYLLATVSVQVSSRIKKYLLDLYSYLRASANCAFSVFAVVGLFLSSLSVSERLRDMTYEA